MSQPSLRERLPFPTAAIFCIIYFVLNVFRRFFLNPIIYGSSIVFGIDIFNLVFLMSILTMIVLLFIKTPNVGFTIVLGMLLMVRIYWVFNEATAYYAVTEFLQISALSLLCVQSVSIYTSFGKNGLNKIWFLAGLLSITSVMLHIVSFVMFMINEVVYLVDYMPELIAFYVINLILQVFYAIFVFMLGKWFKAVAHVKHNDFVQLDAFVENTCQTDLPRNTYVVPQSQQPAPNCVKPVAPPAQYNMAQELQKYKDLYEQDLISEEEYMLKKKQILGL